MKTNTLLLAVGIISAGLAGCHPNIPSKRGSFLEQFGISASDLKADCNLLVSENVQTGKDAWEISEKLPEHLSHLSPQFVHLRVLNAATVVNIQISGGFNHQGLLVVCARQDADFVPVTGRNWKIKKIATDVYEYKE